MTENRSEIPTHSSTEVDQKHGNIYCALWEKTKVLAQDRNLQMSSMCPLDSVCDGSGCFILDHKDFAKLLDLRKELNEIVNPAPTER